MGAPQSGPAPPMFAGKRTVVPVLGGTALLATAFDGHKGLVVVAGAAPGTDVGDTVARATFNAELVAEPEMTLVEAGPSRKTVVVPRDDLGRAATAISTLETGFGRVGAALLLASYRGTPAWVNPESEVALITNTSSKGLRLATVAYLVDLRAGKVRQTIRSTAADAENASVGRWFVTSAAFVPGPSADTNLLVVGTSMGPLLVWNEATGAFVSRLAVFNVSEQLRVTDLAAAGAGCVVAARSNGALELWSVAAAPRVTNLRMPDGDCVSSVSVDPVGALVSSIVVPKAGGPRPVDVRRLGTGQVVYQTRPSDEFYSTLLFRGPAGVVHVAGTTRDGAEALTLPLDGAPGSVARLVSANPWVVAAAAAPASGLVCLVHPTNEFAFWRQGADGGWTHLMTWCAAGPEVFQGEAVGA